MIKRWLIATRAKSKAYRQRVALGAATVVTGFAFVLWAFTTPLLNGSDAPIVTQSAQSPQAFSSLVDGIKSQFEGTKTAVGAEDAGTEDLLVDLQSALEAGATAQPEPPRLNASSTVVAPREVRIITASSSASSSASSE